MTDYNKLLNDNIELWLDNEITSARLVSLFTCYMYFKTVMEIYSK